MLMGIISYTPGYSQNAVSFVSKRSLDSHGAFFESYLSQGLSVLDCGCGPGSITADIAKGCSQAMSLVSICQNLKSKKLNLLL